MVQRTGTQGQGHILFVQNNFYYDAFFLKAIGMWPCLGLASETYQHVSAQWRVWKFRLQRCQYLCYVSRT